MTHTNENQPVDRDIIKEVMSISRSVKSIKGITQVEGIFKVSRMPLVDEEIEARVQEFTPQAIQNESNLSIRIPYGFIALSPKEDGDPEVLFEVLAKFQIDYDIDGTEKLPNDTLVAFGQTNSRINLTSYWREWLSSCLSRADLPAYLVPPVNAQSRFAKIREDFKLSQANVEVGRPSESD